MTSANSAHRTTHPKLGQEVSSVHPLKMPEASRSQEQAQNRTEITSTASFLDTLRMTLKWEGGFSNDPDDNGKATMFGIIQAEYNRYRKAHNLPQQFVGAISKQEMMAIYKEKYWDSTGCNQLPPRIAALNFDTAVNCGTGGAQKVMRRALALSGFDMQQLSNLTRAQETEFLAAHTQARMERYRGICQRWEDRGKPRAWKFMDGWANRTCDFAKYVGVNSDTIAKIFDRATIASANGTARDWIMPTNWRAGEGNNLIISLAGRLRGWGGNIVALFSTLTSIPQIELKIEQIERPPMETRCLEQREDSIEGSSGPKTKLARHQSRERAGGDSIFCEATKAQTQQAIIRERLKKEQQELQAALARAPRAKR